MRYFFHIRDENGLVRDEEGSELAGIEDARKEAHLSARDLIIDDVRRGQRVAPRIIEITDENGQILESVPVRQIVD